MAMAKAKYEVFYEYETGVRCSMPKSIHSAKVTMTTPRGAGGSESGLIPVPSTVIPDWNRIYPERFRSIGGAPEVIFCMGNIELLAQPAVMVCGSRNVSENGMELAHLCGRLIAERGFAVASGYARGVDTAAHLGALEAGGGTIAIVPYGLNRFRICNCFRGSFDHTRFLAVSEKPPSECFTRDGALRRNKLLAALARAVIVVEPGDTGGTWFSARYAVAVKRPLFFLEGAKPEMITRLKSLGGIRLEVKDSIPDMEPVFSVLKGEQTIN